MPIRQRGRASKNVRTRPRESFLRTTTVPVASIPWTWNTDFAMSNPTVATRSMMALPPAQPAITTAGGRRAVHDIKSGTAALERANSNRALAIAPVGPGSAHADGPELLRLLE